MNCAQHTDVTATAFCRECGKPMCPECQRQALGSVYCDVHVPVTPPVAAQPPAVWTPPPPHSGGSYSASFASGESYSAGAGTPYTDVPPGSSPYSAAYTAPEVVTKPDESVHPVAALVLGLIPGVGAIYNGQYAKGLVHAVVFGLMVSTIANSHNGGMEALLGIMIAAWVFYMAFEAYHTARKRRFGTHVEEFGGQFDIRPTGGRAPMGAILLIGLGFIFLLDTTDIISIDDFGKYWPLLLILFGVYLLYNRLHGGGPADAARRDAEARR